MRSKYLVTILASAAVAAASPGVVQAAETDEPFGRHVSMCAQTSHGKRATPPAVTCTHDGMTMTFATFGAMVQHMLEHHGGR